MKLIKNVTKMPALLIAVVLVAVGFVLIGTHTKKNHNPAYYRCALGVNAGYARCALIGGPTTCYPSYKLLGRDIDVSPHDVATATTCEGIAPDKVNYYDNQGHFIETKSYNGEL